MHTLLGFFGFFSNFISIHYWSCTAEIINGGQKMTVTNFFSVGKCIKNISNLKMQLGEDTVNFFHDQSPKKQV